MKFTRIVAAFTFATLLIGSVPVQANGLFDWLTGLFEDNKSEVQPARRPERVQRFEQRRPQQNAQRFNQPHGGRHGRVQQRRQERPQQPARPTRRPAQQNNNRRPLFLGNRRPVTQTALKEQTGSKAEAFMKSLGLVGVGIAVSVLFTQTGLVDKLRDLLGLARPTRDMNELAREFNETTNAVKGFMASLNANNRRPAQQAREE